MQPGNIFGRADHCRAAEAAEAEVYWRAYRRCFSSEGYLLRIWSLAADDGLLTRPCDLTTELTIRWARFCPRKRVRRHRHHPQSPDQVCQGGQLPTPAGFS